jgi:hypothetical protein
MKKINQYKRTYNKERGVLLGLVIAFVIGVLPNLSDMGKEVYVREEVAVHIQATVPETKDNTPSKKEIEEKIKHYFPKSYPTMIAVAYAESGLNHNSQNWNCWYNKDETIVYSNKVKGTHSTSCKKSHRVYSWSIDCGTLMKNYIGIKQCPKVSVDEHLKEMAELSKARGFNPWFGYTNGSYKKYLSMK